MFGKAIFFVQLGYEISRSNDRSGYQLRKKSDEKCEVRKFFDWFQSTPINLDRVTNTLKSKKGNPNGQDMILSTLEMCSEESVAPMRHPIENMRLFIECCIINISKKIRVFEITQAHLNSSQYLLPAKLF
jgi:hypothetical protein